MLEILNFHEEKLKPEAILIVNNVRKVLVRLSRKSPWIPILQEFKHRTKLDFSPLNRPPENPLSYILPRLLNPHHFRLTENLGWLLIGSPKLQDAANLYGPTIQKGRKRFCKHSVISLSEANCDAQVRDARASASDHRVKPEESCADCNSSIQEEIMTMLTNRIIPEVEQFLCTGTQ